MIQIKVRLIGTRPLLMHADIFADPLNPLTQQHKSLTSKRKKTDDDHMSIAKSEWLGGMYFDDQLGPYLPGINIEAAMVAGGKLSKMGTQLKRSAEIVDDMCALEYEGPRDQKGLWEAGFYDSRSVKVSTARLVRYRPIFKEWATTCTVAFHENAIDQQTVIKSLEDGGAFCGVGDFRPKFGRFRVEVIGEVEHE